MGRASFKAGGVFAQNLQAGSFNITADSNGDGTTTVTFAKTLKSTPAVVLTVATQLETGVISHGSQSNTSFQARLDGSDVTGTIAVNYIAFDDTYN